MCNVTHKVHIRSFGQKFETPLNFAVRLSGGVTGYSGRGPSPPDPPCIISHTASQTLSTLPALKPLSASLWDAAEVSELCSAADPWSTPRRPL